jgi:hypothetical protein
MERDPHIPGVFIKHGAGLGGIARVMERTDRAFAAFLGFFASKSAGRLVVKPG